MIFDAARLAISQLFTPPFRSVFFKTIGLTLLLLVASWFGAKELFEYLAMPWIDQLFPGLPSWVGWLGLIAAIVAGIGLALVLALLIAPVSAVVAGIFLDEIAEAVERDTYPQDPPGKAVPLGQSLVLSVKFFGIVVIGNIIALLLLLVPGVNLIAFFVVNAYLLSREFFQFAAMRFVSEAEARELRRRNSGTIFLAGFVIAALLSVPIVNLLTPLFGAAMMMHLYKAIAARQPTARRIPEPAR